MGTSLKSLGNPTAVVSVVRQQTRVVGLGFKDNKVLVDTRAAVLTTGRPTIVDRLKERLAKEGTRNQNEVEILWREVRDIYSEGGLFGPLTYDAYMGDTGHYAALGALIRRFKGEIQLPIIDLASGTSELLSILLRTNGTIGTLKEVIEADPGPPAIVAVDLSDDSQKRAEMKLVSVLSSAGLASSVGRNDSSSCFSPISLRAFPVEQLLELFPGLEGTANTVTISYYMHWAGGGVKEGENKRVSNNPRLWRAKLEVLLIASALLSQGGRLLSFEEFPLQTSSSATMPPELDRAIRDHTSEITFEELAQLADSAGFRLITTGEQLIDPEDVAARRHIMTASVFERLPDRTTI